MLKMHQITKHYTILKDESLKDKKDKKIICKLCPNNCVIADGKSGLCGTRINIDGKFYSTTYGYPCSIHLDPIEKKPLYHYYPGQEILSFGTFGCNMFCKGCQNYDITRADVNKTISASNAPKYYSPEDIIDIAMENDIKLIAYTYNEPTIFFEYMIDIAKLARKNGIKNVIVSNGYINPAPLKELCKYIDAANIDIKGITEKFYRQYSRVSIEPVLKTVKMLHEVGIWIELTNLIIPGLNDDEKDMHKLCEWICDNVGKNVPVHFSRFYPYYHAMDIPPTPPLTLEKARTIALKTGIKYVYIGNLGFLDNTYCDKCKELLIDRSGEVNHVNSINILCGLTGKENNKCAKCGTVLPGVFK